MLHLKEWTMMWAGEVNRQKHQIEILPFLMAIALVNKCLQQKSNLYFSEPAHTWRVVNSRVATPYFPVIVHDITMNSASFYLKTCSNSDNKLHSYPLCIVTGISIYVKTLKNT